MTTLDDLLMAEGLQVVGQLQPGVDDPVPEGTAELALIGAKGDAMWERFSQSPERLDGAPNPLDRWSLRVIGAIAKQIDAIPLFPFGGPPWLPFLRWASIGEGARLSPVAMQVSPSRGLWMSYRGALAFSSLLESTEGSTGDPCLGCPAPCLVACPVNAFAGGRYDVPRCTSHITSHEGRDCHDGCLARAACPVGARPPLKQRQFHMSAFISAHSRPDPLQGN